MTIVLGMIGHNYSLIVTDSRLMSSVILDNGVPQNEIKIESNSFNKTFKAADGNIIGGFSGLMRFSGKTSGVHMGEILNQVLPSHRNIDKCLENVCEDFMTRLLEIDETEVAFQHRSVSFILSTSLGYNFQQFALYNVCFSPSEKTIGYSINKKSKKKLNAKTWDWEIIGDTDALNAAQKHCNTLYYASHKRDFGNMLSIAKRSIKKGVSNSSFYRGSKYRSCGGETAIVQIR